MVLFDLVSSFFINELDFVVLLIFSFESRVSIVFHSLIVFRAVRIVFTKHLLGYEQFFIFLQGLTVYFSLCCCYIILAETCLDIFFELNRLEFRSYCLNLYIRLCLSYYIIAIVNRVSRNFFFELFELGWTLFF